MVGQYHGPEGAAALAVVAPIWNIIYSLGLLMGIGGSVLFSTMRGKGDGQTRQSNEYFTVSIIGSILLAVIAWIGIAFFDEPLLRFCGAEGHTLTLAREYVLPIKFVIPCFLFTQTLAAYLRNDKTPPWPPPPCWRAASLTYLAITSLFSPAIWGRSVQGLPQPSVP